MSQFKEDSMVELMQVLCILAELLEQPMPENELRAAWMIDSAYFQYKVITRREAMDYLAILIQSMALVEDKPYWMKEVVLIHHRINVVTR
jgi:hypothetical protein